MVRFNNSPPFTPLGAFGLPISYREKGLGVRTTLPRPAASPSLAKRGGQGVSSSFIYNFILHLKEKNSALFTPLGSRQLTPISYREKGEGVKTTLPSLPLWGASAAFPSLTKRGGQGVSYRIPIIFSLTLSISSKTSLFINRITLKSF